MDGTRWCVALAIVTLAVGAGACGGAVAPEPPTSGEVRATEPPASTGAPPTTASEPPTSTGEPVSEPPATAEPDLPLSVEATRDAIVAAAHRRDYDALAALVDPETFSYSFGESGDPIGYWQRLEGEAEVPVLGDFLPLVLSMPFELDDGIYVWPSAATRAPGEWTPRDVEAIARLYPADDIAGFRAAGDYLGWRVGIRADGTWLYFVSGD